MKPAPPVMIHFMASPPDRDPTSIPRGVTTGPNADGEQDVGRPRGGGVKGRERAREARRAEADAAYADLTPTSAELRAEGLSLRQGAARLDAEGHTSRRGEPWR